MPGKLSRFGTQGITLVEVLTSAVCLSFLTAAVTGSIRYASMRQAYESQRLEVMNILQSDMDVLRAYGRNGGLGPTSQTWGMPVPWQQLPFRRENVTFTESVVQTSPTICTATLSATWQGDQVRTLSLSSQILTLKSPTVLSTITINPTDNFAFAGNATVPWIDLNALGVPAGSTITIRRIGNYYFGDITTWDGLLGIFSSTASLDSNIYNVSRVTGAVPVPSSNLTNWGRWFGNSVYDQRFQPETFLIADLYNGGQDRVTITVPPGANYLALEAIDLHWDDNYQGSPILQAEISVPTPNLAPPTPVIADSQRDFAGQGLGGWVYGYYGGINDPLQADVTKFIRLNRYVQSGTGTDLPWHRHDIYTVDGSTWANPNQTGINDIFVIPNCPGDATNAVAARRWVAPRDIVNASVNVVVTHTVQSGDASFRLISVAPGSGVSNVLWQGAFASGDPAGTTASISRALGSIPVGTILEFEVGTTSSAAPWNQLSMKVNGQ